MMRCKLLIAAFLALAGGMLAGCDDDETKSANDGGAKSVTADSSAARKRACRDIGMESFASFGGSLNSPFICWDRKTGLLYGLMLENK